MMFVLFGRMPFPCGITLQFKHRDPATDQIDISVGRNPSLLPTSANQNVHSTGFLTGALMNELSIRFFCTVCGNTLLASQDAIGTQCSCSRCKTNTVVPGTRANDVVQAKAVQAKAVQVKAAPRQCEPRQLGSTQLHRYRRKEDLPPSGPPPGPMDAILASLSVSALSSNPQWHDCVAVYPKADWSQSDTVVTSAAFAGDSDSLVGASEHNFDTGYYMIDEMSDQAPASSKTENTFEVADRRNGAGGQRLAIACGLLMMIALVISSINVRQLSESGGEFSWELMRHATPEMKLTMLAIGLMGLLFCTAIRPLRRV